MTDKKQFKSHESIEKDFVDETGIEWFCPEPYGNIYTETTGEYKACCSGADFYDVKTDTHTPIEAMNCNTAKELRSAFVTKNKKILNEHCKMCIVQEKSGIKSSRQYSMEHYINNTPAFDSVVKIAKQVKEDPKIDIKPEYFHTMEHLAGGGNFCNLKCLMCHPYKSSSFASEALELGEDINVFNITKPLIKPPTNKKVNDEIQGYILERLDEIKFTGGEPLMIPYNYELLEKAVDLKTSYKQNLRIITNGTNIPKMKGKDIFDYIPHFKYVTFNISIEAWGVRNNYIRYPSDFNKILDNANELANTFSNVSVSFASTINSLNIGYVDNFFRYSPLVNKKFRQPVMSSYVLKWEDFDTNVYHGMNISSLPYDIREIYLNRYFTLESDIAIKMKPYIKILENRDHNMEDTKILISRLKKRDKLRNTNLLEMWPEWEKYYV
jgi:organic radical activating enzyme